MYHHSAHLSLYRAGLLLSALLLCCVASAQTAETAEKLADYARNIITFNREHPQEKVYLHMDNRSYFIGDTIWFKAYVMNATTLHPTQQSGVLYVELLNEKGVEMERKKMRLENGMCHGEFVLKDDYRTGYYEVRAYTRYMLNFGNSSSKAQELAYEQMNVTERDAVKYDYKRSESSKDLIPDHNYCIFSRTVPVYKCPEQAGVYKREMEFYPYHTLLAMPTETNEEDREDNLTLSFYPEGGHMVAGVENTVAFEAVDQWGKKQKVEGYITKGRNERLMSISTDTRGRGTFVISPQDKEIYKAHVSYKGKEYSFKLPQVTNSGIAIHLLPPVGNSDMGVVLRTTKDKDAELLGMSVQCRGSFLYLDTISVGPDMALPMQISHDVLRTGVHQFTLFNARGEILADRLFFVSPPKQPRLIMTDLPDSVKPYDAVTLNMRMVSANNWPIQGLFSLSVTDADERDHSFDTRDIRSELLLASDLKGFIENVDSYFSHDDDSLMAVDLDRLMLIQGWRRYEWIDTLRNEYTPEKGLQLDGYVISDILADKSRRNPDNYLRIPNLTMEVSIKNDMVTFTDTCSVVSAGRYHLDIARHFTGEAPMTLTLSEKGATKSKKRHQRIIPSDTDLRYSYPIIHRVYSPLPDAYSYYQSHMPSDEAQLAANDSADWAMEGSLDEVTVKKRRKRNNDIHYENPEMVINYFKEWNHVIDRGCPLMNYHGGENPDNTVLLNYHLGRMRLSHGEQALREYDSLYTRQLPRYYKPYHMPDTIKVYTNLCTREQLSVRKNSDETEYRDILRCVFSYFDRSESPRRAPYMPNNGTRHTYYEGYSRVHSFYSPDYSDCALPDTADYRRTLHWDPDIWTDNLGRASVTFYNNSQTKHLHIRAEGFTRNGEFIVYDSEQKQ